MIRPEVVSESGLLDRDLNRYDCIFLCNIGQFTADEALLLDRYLQQGGGLITILGDRVQADRYNRQLGGVDNGAQILPARLAEAYSDGNYHYIDPGGYQHPLLSRWRGKPKSGLTTVPVLKFIRLQLPPATDARVVLGLDTGDPLLVEQKIGRGRSLLLATDVATTSVAVTDQQRRPWSLLASWLNCQPFLESLWQAAVGGRLDERNVMVGDTVSAAAETTAANAPLVVTRPAAAGDGPPLTAETDLSGWSYAETEFSGIYTVRRDDQEEPWRKFAVNVRTEEGDLQRIRPEDLPADMLLAGDSGAATLAPTAGLTAAGFELHQGLLCTVLALLFLEIFLAWWMGSRSA